jgi:catechol 2,3-dioxygenase-like lactoylglutathione lyase family enzyme
MSIGELTFPLVVEIEVRNLARSLDFYRALGFEVARVDDGFASLRWHHAWLFLNRGAGGGGHPASTTNLRILVADVDAAWEAAQALGAVVDAPVGDRGYGLRDFTIRDPDGFALRFAAPVVPSPERSPLELVRALYLRLEAGESGEALSDLFTEDARTVEHPNLLRPTGGVATRAEMIARSKTGASILASQSYRIREAVEAARVVAVRVTWTGVMARDAGTLRAGQVLTAHIAQFVRAKDGRIESIDTYDCYEPLPGGDNTG